MPVQNFIHLRPHQLRAAISEFPLALVPLGSLEWHSLHLPLGMDGLKAEALLRQVGNKIDKGIIFPCRWWGGIKTMNFPMTHEIPTRGQKKFFKSTVQWLYDAGFRVIILLTGHYPANLTKMLVSVSKKFMKKHTDAFVFGLPEFILLWDLNYFGDHAAQWETSISMALFPELVDLNRLPKNLPFIERERQLGIMGNDPVEKASKELGEKATSLFIDRMVGIINECWSKNNQEPILQAYRQYDEAFKKLINLRDLNPAMDVLGMTEWKDFLRHAKWMTFGRLKGEITKEEIGKNIKESKKVENHDEIS